VALPAGVGLVEAGIGAARAIAQTRAGAVIFVGTAGIYPDKRKALEVGRAVIARGVRLVSTAALREEGYLPAVLPATVRTDTDLRRALARASRLALAEVACPLAITTAPEMARRIARETGAEVENLEAFAVARAASAAGTRFAAVLGLSNAVGPKAHRQWRAFAATASAAACAAVLAWVRATTPPSGRRS
jgi:purine-nucleoside phosphorylase